MLYLDRSATISAIPSLAEQVRLAETALISVVTGGEVPGKSSVHPRPQSSIAYAMPASLAQSTGDVGPALGMKWVTVVPENSQLGLPTVNSLIILNDPQTTAPIAILDGSAITAVRTAAVSGVAISRLARDAEIVGLRIAIIGAGTQGHSHVAMLGHVAPGVDLVLHDQDARRAIDLAATARETPGIRTAAVADSAQEAIQASDVVVTATSFGPMRQLMAGSWLRPEALVIAVDYDMYASAEVASTSSVFLVDEISGFLNARAEGRFEGFPDPTGTLGAFLVSGSRRPPGRVLVAHLGMGLTDLVFAASVVSRATEMGLGLALPNVM
jgi:Predicted ornithine cyclodeaminase, mu-crystallin homolog